MDFTFLLYLIVPILLVLIAGISILIKQYKRCPSNKILVVFGKVAGERTAKCIHGGGIFVVPMFQDFEYMSLEPRSIDINLTSALSKKNIRVDVPSTFTVGISTLPDIITNAAERLLGLNDMSINDQAKDIILGQLRLVVATLSIEEINQDREKFLELVNQNVGIEINKIGLEVINVNIRDITDESGYIEAIGKKAAAEAINKAKVEVAEQVKEGAIGEATANKLKEVEVAEQKALTDMGLKKAERDQRITVAKLEAEGVTGEAEAERTREVAIAEQKSKKEQGQKNAEMEQRIKIAELEAKAIEGENSSKANIASYNATLLEKEADSNMRSNVAKANSKKSILEAQKNEELARLEKEVLVQQEIEKNKIKIEAEAEADKTRMIAESNADAVKMKFQAEANGIQQVLNAKAEGYQQLIKALGSNPQLAPTLLMIEKLPEIVKEQVKAIQNLKIDKITVWDSGSDGGTTSDFLRSFSGALPPIHELAKQAGIELPGFLGNVKEAIGTKEIDNKRKHEND